MGFDIFFISSYEKHHILTPQRRNMVLCDYQESIVHYLPALDKGINVVIQTFLNDFDGFFSVAFFIDCGGLVLQCFIYCEEMLHLVHHMTGQLGNIMIAVIIRIIERYCNDLLIVFAVIQHGDHTDRIRSYQSHRLYRLGTQ